MFIIENVIVPPELRTLKFVCSYRKCHSACCIEGEAGAPISPMEAMLIMRNKDTIMSHLRGVSAEWAEKHGLVERSITGQWQTICRDKSGPCVFFDEADFETACILQRIRDKETNETLRPLSCRLFPFRIRRRDTLIILDYERWDACAAAWNGNRLLIDFCKDALVGAFGQEWVLALYNQLGVPVP